MIIGWQKLPQLEVQTCHVPQPTQYFPLRLPSLPPK
jgi:hypothetical protein